ncbi:MAG: RHS repeat-associated core domain-containing protein, partial [Akkermansiaceae bacterium]|nr:RHS repeat-associated core domain-containing protein [Akkermansiaceae bacterium]
ILSSFKYVGLGMMVAQKYNAAANTELTYGDSSNDYNGYDLFGRIAKTLWQDGSNVEQVESKYGYNRGGGIVWRRDVLAHNQTPTAADTQDNYYWYDGLYQVKQHERGDLAGIAPNYSGIKTGSRQQQEIFTFDETGNWLSYDRANPSPALNQDRTHNKANEITSISPTSGAGAAVQPVYDKAGNMTTMPQPADWESGYDCTWDAWNRLVKIEDGATTVAEYRYDALTRRISQATSAGFRRYFYNNQWRVIEEWDTTGTTDREYVYNPADRWNLIRRKYTDSSPLDTTHYVLRDFLDPVAIINTSGVVQERYGYEAFGAVRYMTGTFGDLTSSAFDWNWLFHGEFLDVNTGLYNYGYRYYHPQLGRWPSRDPIGERGGVNLYGMVGNDSVNWVDFLGLESTGKPKCSLKICIAKDESANANEKTKAWIEGQISSQIKRLQELVDRCTKSGKCCCSKLTIRRVDMKKEISDDELKMDNPQNQENRKGNISTLESSDYFEKDCDIRVVFSGRNFTSKTQHENAIGQTGGIALSNYRPNKAGGVSKVPGSGGIVMGGSGATSSNLAHEIAHITGWSSGDLHGGNHTSKKDHIMAWDRVESLVWVDATWCKSICDFSNRSKK